MQRPIFQTAWSTFMAVRRPVKDVGRIIGGKVQENIDLPVGGFENACPIRMSYILNKTGFPIPKSGRYAMVSGGDRMQYIYRVRDMMQYLEDAFGAADTEVSSPRPDSFKGKQGIVVIKGSGWGNATGHVTLWDGTLCADSCHLLGDPDNGSFVPESGALWELP
jgi:hypothetical protein